MTEIASTETTVQPKNFCERNMEEAFRLGHTLEHIPFANLLAFAVRVTFAFTLAIALVGTGVGMALYLLGTVMYMLGLTPVLPPFSLGPS